MKQENICELLVPAPGHELVAQQMLVSFLLEPHFPMTMSKNARALTAHTAPWKGWQPPLDCPASGFTILLAQATISAGMTNLSNLGDRTTG